MADNPIDPKNIKALNDELAQTEDALTSISVLLKETLEKSFENFSKTTKNIANIYTKNITKNLQQSAKISNDILKISVAQASGINKSKDIEKQILDLNRDASNEESIVFDDGHIYIA